MMYAYVQTHTFFTDSPPNRYAHCTILSITHILAPTITLSLFAWIISGQFPPLNETLKFQKIDLNTKCYIYKLYMFREGLVRSKLYKSTIFFDHFSLSFCVCICEKEFLLNWLFEPNPAKGKLLMMEYINIWMDEWTYGWGNKMFHHLILT